MATEKVLFIGGCADGQWIEVQDQNRVLYATTRGLRARLFVDNDAAILTNAIPRDEYHMRYIQCGDGLRRKLFAEKAIPDSEALDRLLQHYDPRDALVRAVVRADNQQPATEGSPR